MMSSPDDLCEYAGHEWAPAGGDLEICLRCEEEQWGYEEFAEGIAVEDSGNELVPLPTESLEKRNTEELRGAESQAALERAIQDHILNDFELALDLIRRYQEILKRLCSPDPLFEEARKLMAKYKVPYGEPSEAFKIFLDGRDITTYADSLPGSLAELESGDDDNNG